MGSLWRTLAMAASCTWPWPQPSFSQGPSPGSLIHGALCIGPGNGPLDMFKLIQLEPHCTGPWTCSNLFNLDLTVQGPAHLPPQDMIKLVHYGARTVGKWAVGIRLKFLLLIVNSSSVLVNMFRVICWLTGDMIRRYFLSFINSTLVLCNRLLLCTISHTRRKEDTL